MYFATMACKRERGGRHEAIGVLGGIFIYQAIFSSNFMIQGQNIFSKKAINIQIIQMIT